MPRLTMRLAFSLLLLSATTASADSDPEHPITTDPPQVPVMFDVDDVPQQLGFLFVDYYGADLQDLEKRATWISEYDLAVALHLTRLADIDLDEIVKWRREGSSWDAITRRCALGCEVFYVDIPNDVTLPAPYARPYVTWRQQPGADLRLTDEEVRELVLLAALSEHCSLAPEQVVQLRSAGQTPRAIFAMHPASRDTENTTPSLPPEPPPGATPGPR